jgi:hypothetical protein
MLSDLDRRTIGNLAIPRNVPDLTQVLREDPNTNTRPDGEVADHLAGLAQRGLVVKLGGFEDAVKAAGAAEKNTHARSMQEDEAAIYARRLNHPRFRWRMDGDLWVITDDGIAEMHAPTVAARTLTPMETQAVVDAEWARTLKGVTTKNYNEAKHGEALKGGVLEDHFLVWYKDVADECERVWNVRPRAPLAGGGSWSDTYENFILDLENQKTSLATNDPITAPWFMALQILALTDASTPTTANDGTHKPTYTGYLPVGVPAASMLAATGGSSNDTTAITFAACTGGTDNILGFANCISITGSTVTGAYIRKWGSCASTTISATQTPATFAIGAYVTTAD